MAGKTLMTLMTLAMLAMLAAGCSSDSDSPTAVDLAPPAVPTDLGFDYDSGAVALSWAPNTTDADFVGFTLTRTVNGVTEQLIDTPTDITSFTDSSPRPGINMYYLAAVDRAGNESAFASIQVVIDRYRGFVTPWDN